MQESSAGAARAVHHILGQPLKVIGIVVLCVADHLHQPRPAPADADHFVSFSKRPKSDRANRRIQSRHVAAPREKSDHALYYIDIRHISPFASVWISATNDYGRCNEIYAD